MLFRTRKVLSAAGSFCARVYGCGCLRFFYRLRAATPFLWVPEPIPIADKRILFSSQRWVPALSSGFKGTRVDRLSVRSPFVEMLTIKVHSPCHHHQAHTLVAHHHPHQTPINGGWHLVAIEARLCSVAVGSKAAIGRSVIYLSVSGRTPA